MQQLGCDTRMKSIGSVDIVNGVCRSVVSRTHIANYYTDTKEVPLASCI